MRIFITGGTGFIGKALLGKLKNSKHDLLVLSRNPSNLKAVGNLKFLKGDLSESEKVKKVLTDFKPEIVIHLAWQGIPDYSLDSSMKNFEYTFELFRICSLLNCKKVIAAGSLWEYGARTGKVSEIMHAEPYNIFTAVKLSLLNLGREVFKETGTDFFWLRIFYVYGPGQREGSLIPSIINSLKLGLKPEIRNPNAKNDFIYVDDVAEAIISFLTQKAVPGIYNVGSGKLTSIRSILSKISQSYSYSFQTINTKPRQQDKLGFIRADISKIKSQTGWQPKTKFNDGLLKTVEYFKS